MQRMPGTTRQNERQFGPLPRWYGRMVAPDGTIGRTFEAKRSPELCAQDYREWQNGHEARMAKFVGAVFQIVRVGRRNAAKSRPAEPRFDIPFDPALHQGNTPPLNPEEFRATERRIEEALDRVHGKDTVFSEAAKRAGLG